MPSGSGAPRNSDTPLFGDHTSEDRFDEWRLKDSGRWHLHGHTHDPSRRVHDGQLHVGIDAWGRPVTEDEIAAVIAASEGGTLKERIGVGGAGTSATTGGPIPSDPLISQADARQAD